MNESPTDWLREPLSSYRVIVHPGFREKPRWYDFPRRLGWRPLKWNAFMKGNEVVIDRIHNIIYCTPKMEETLRRALPERYFASPR